MNDLNEIDIKLALNNESLDTIERIYSELHQVFNDNEPTLLKYQFHFQTLYDSLNLVLKSESQLKDRLIDLKRENKDLSARYVQAIKLADVDKKTSLQIVNSLKREVFNFTKLVEQASGVYVGQNYNWSQITEQNETLNADNKKLNEDLDELRQEINSLKKLNTDLVKQGDEFKLREINAKQELLTVTMALHNSSRRIQKSEEEISNQRKLTEQKDALVASLSHSIQMAKIDLNKQEGFGKEMQLALEKSRKEVDSLIKRNERIQFELDQQLLQNDTLQVDMGQLNLQIKRKDDLLEQLKFDNVQKLKKRDLLEDKIRKLEEKFNFEKAENEKLKHELDESLKLRLEIVNQKESDRKQIEKLINENEKLKQELKATLSQMEKHGSNFKAQQSELKSIKREHLELKLNSQKLTRDLANFDTERNSLKATINELNARINELNGAIKEKQTEVENLNKNIQTGNMNLEKLKTRFESVRIDSNQNSKKLVQVNLELNQCKSQSENLKEQLIGLNKQIKESDLKRIRAENEILKKEELKNQRDVKLEELKVKLNEAKSQLDKFSQSELELLNLIKKADIKCKSMEGYIRRLLFERNILGSQLVRRNDELSLLYERIERQQKCLNSGEVCLESCVNNLKLSKKEVEMSRREKAMLEMRCKQVGLLQKELNVKEKELMIERAKLVTNEEMTQVNVHRWRKLAGCDPTTYELLTSVHTLQKRLISKTERLVFMEMKFQEKDRIFLQLKQYYSRRLISQDNADLLRECRVKMENSERKVKALMAENRMLTKKTQPTEIKVE